MALWYCHINGKQYGPVDESEFRAWIAEGRIRPENHVWGEGMANWVPLSSLPQFAGVQSMPPPPPYSGIPPAPGGTGGQTPNAELMRQARERLRGKWGAAIGFCVLMVLVSLTGAIPFVGGIISLVISGPIALGQAIFFLSLTRRGNTNVGMLFEGFKNFGNALAAYILMAIFVFLWSLLLIIPGIIAQLAYSQTYYILANDKKVDALEAIRQSKKMMYGHKWKYFCLGLRFFGWMLLCILTLGIGLLWLYPYMFASYARFYDDLHGRATAAAVSGTVAIDSTQITPAQTDKRIGDASGPVNDTFGDDLIGRS